VVGDIGIWRLKPEREIALFRIAQEALNNVAKHARATRIRIELERVNSHVIMTISDDGVGIGAAPTSVNRHRVRLGMVTMRERTEALGGKLEVSAAEGKSGTLVRVHIPF
jgi:signal transduction histidine kinase